jgi:hypothetical protein
MYVKATLRWSEVAYIHTSNICMYVKATLRWSEVWTTKTTTKTSLIAKCQTVPPQKILVFFPIFFDTHELHQAHFVERTN